MGVERDIGDPAEAQYRPRQLGLLGSLIMGITPTPEVGEREIIGIRVAADGTIVVQLDPAGAITPTDNRANALAASFATYSLLGGYNRLDNDWGRIDRFVPIGTDIGALVVAGIGSGFFRYAEGPDSIVSFPLGGDIPFEVQAFPQIRVRGSQDFAPPRAGYTGAIDSGGVDATPNVLAAGAYNAAAPTLADGEGGALQLTARGTLITIGGPPVPGSGRVSPSFACDEGVGSLIAKAATGNLLALDVSSADAAGFWVQVFDASAPPAAASPVGSNFCRRLPAGGSLTVGRDFFGEGGRLMATGITVVLSSTRDTYTPVVGTPDVTLAVSYV